MAYFIPLRWLMCGNISAVYVQAQGEVIVTRNESQGLRYRNVAPRVVKYISKTYTQFRSRLNEEGTTTTKRMDIASGHNTASLEK